MSNTDDLANYDVFRDCLLAAVVERLAPTAETRRQRASKSKSLQPVSVVEHKPKAHESNAPSDLADFAEYLSEDIFTSLPRPFRCLSHQSTEDDPQLAEIYSLPLTLSTIEDLTSTLPPSITDTLTSYGLITPPNTDTQSFFHPIFSAYITSTTTPPPKWIATRASSCEICDRDWVPLTYHHLIPRQVHAKVLKRGWHDEARLNSVAWLCRACHSFVHRMASNEELAREWFTVERIGDREDVKKWAGWVGRVRWKKT